MKRRLISVIMFALVAAAASSTVLYKIISASTQHTVKAAGERVLVAARDLEAGALVAEADVREIEWPSGGASQWIRRREDVIGRGLLSAMGKDEPFAETRLAAKGAGAGLASRIPTGMRVIPVHVDELTGLSRFILSGMHVDVISTGQGVNTRTILQNIEVFSTGQNLERDAKEGKDKPAAAQAFNLLVTPQQAEVLSQAVAQTRIELVLRNPLDKASFLSAFTVAPRLPSDLPLPRLARAAAKPPPTEKIAPPPPPPPPPPAPTVEVIHGTKKTVSAVGATGDSEPKQ